MSIRPTNPVAFISSPTLLSNLPRVSHVAPLPLNTISSLQPMNCFSTFFSKIYEWLKQIFPSLFISTATRTNLTAQELEQRVQKGHDFINNSIDHHLGDRARNMLRDRLLVRMEYTADT